MSLYRYAGTLLRIAGGALAKACCCTKYWCVPAGTYCDMLWYTCLQDPQASLLKYGPYEANTCNGECIPPEPCWEDYYCCYYSLDEYGQPVGGTYCNQGQCPSEALTASGPHRTLAECQYNCQRHSCVPATCTQCAPFEPASQSRCVPDPEGTYLTSAKCREACGCVAACTLYPCAPANSFVRNPPNCNNYSNQQAGDALTGPYWRTGGQTPAGGTSLVFWVDYEPNRPICVSYSSINGKPIRVQITEPRQTCPTYTGNVNEAIRRDSGWRGLSGCDCPAARPGGGALGAPKGTLKWNTKAANRGHFHVRVFAPCSGSQWKIGVGCECPTIPTTDEPCCDCSQCAISWTLFDDDRVDTSYVAGPCLFGRYDGINRETNLRACGAGICDPENVEWKAGWPAAVGCRPSGWVRSTVQCWNSAMGPFINGTCLAQTQMPAASQDYWRFFVCENGVLVNRTQDAVTAAELLIGGAQVRVTVTATTPGGPALKYPLYIAGADPTGQAGGCCGGAVACPTAVDQIAPLDPVIVC